MNGPSPAQVGIASPPWQRAVVLAPLLAASALGTLMVPGWATPFTALVGPWAGHLLGHAECTMATVASEASWIASAAAAAALGVFLAGPRRWSRWSWTLGALGATVWASLALLSVLNTLS